MEPFRVTCETCRARLKVRDASAIGEIHACPKCGSMVQIAPPQGWTGETANIASAAVLAVADTPEPNFTHVEPPSDALADMFEVAAAAALTPQIANEASSVAFETADVIPVPAQAVPPFVLWSIVASTAVIIGGLAIAMWPDRDTPDTTEQATPIASAAVAALPPEAVADNSSRPSTEQVIASSPEPHTAAKPISEDDDTNTEAATATSDEPSAIPEPPADEIAHSTPTDNDTEVPSSTPIAEIDAESPPPSTTAAGGDQQRTPVLKFDPLDFDPWQFSVGGTASENPPTTSVAEDPPGEVASDFGELSRAEAGTLTETPVAEENDTLLPPQANPTITVRLGPIVNNAAARDIATSLKFKVDSLEAADVPLNRFLQTLSDLSGVPVTLDPLAFELAGSSPRDKITVAAHNVTLDELLKDRLRAKRLNYVERDGHVVISLADGDRQSPREFDVSDLMEAGAADASAVAKLIQTFVAPQSWPSSDGSPTIQVKGPKLRIEQRKAVQHEMLLFCERLRLARGLARKSRYPAELLSIDSPYAKLESPLTAKSTFTFLPWTRLADVLQHWQAASGVTMLADWHRIADVDLRPATPLSCSAVDRTWGQVLDEILEPLGLAWWAVDGTTIQITSREALDEIHRVEFYNISKAMRDQFTSGNALIETLRAELGENVGAPAAAADQLQMHVDKPSRRLIVRGTPQIHRYLSDRLRTAD
ncbi:MAG TPA: hypothetical protein VHK01_09600 [Lacipirellulaceae bacterium]|nr:hypothetical protein [Lacipirellulaceae bacterium]